MAYNLTNLTADNSLLGIMKFANEVTSDWFGILVLLGALIIAFVVMGGLQTDDKTKPFAASVFITFILMLLLRVSEILVNDTVFIVGIVLTGVASLLSLRSNN